MNARQIRILKVATLVPALALASASRAQTLMPTFTAVAVSPVGAAGSPGVVTLTAVVTSGGQPVSPGLVVFCNAVAAHCEDAAVLGRAQLTAAGTATLSIRPGLGRHSIKAIFQGTPHSVTPEAGSVSADQIVTITGNNASATTLSAFGFAGDYSLVASVRTFGRPVETGTVSFMDATSGDSPLGSASFTGQAATFDFASSSNPAPVGVIEVLAADLNEDGIPDLVSATESGLSVQLGLGDGTFSPGVPVSRPPGSVGTYVSAVAAGDLNSDGIQDLAVAWASEDGYSDGKVYVALGNGDGTFTYASDVDGGGSSPGSPVVADFNGDGIPDLAVLNETSGTVTVLQGAGDGTFLAVATLRVGSYPVVLIEADLNGDGIPDLATGNEGDSTLSILLGNGDGTFSTEPAVRVGDYPFATAGDFNGDGIPDLVSANFYDDTLTVLMGNGDGTFTTKSTLALNMSPDQAAATDVNGDGITDLVMAGGVNPNPVPLMVLLGRGDGSFSVGVSGSVGTGPSKVADFNGDGIPDVVLSHYPDTAETILLGALSRKIAINGVLLPVGGNNDVVASYSGDVNYSGSDSPPFSISNTTAPPILTPAPGTYTFAQNVELADATPGATIYYTLDGSRPGAGSAKYVGPIAVSWQSTIRAMATAAGAIDSTAVSGTYAIDRQLQSPQFSVASGTYGRPLTFSLTPDAANCGNASCALYYSIHGGSFTKYTGPVTINALGTTVVEAITTKSHYTTSAPSTVTYYNK